LEIFSWPPAAARNTPDAKETALPVPGQARSLPCKRTSRLEWYGKAKKGSGSGLCRGKKKTGAMEKMQTKGSRRREEMESQENQKAARPAEQGVPY